MPSGDASDAGRFLGDVAKRVGEGKSVGKAVAGAAIPAMLRKVGAKVKRFLFGKSKGPKLTNIVEDLNIGVPVSVAYNQWTQYKEFPSYMKGVQSVDHTDPAEGEEAKSNGQRLQVSPQLGGHYDRADPRPADRVDLDGR